MTQAALRKIADFYDHGINVVKTTNNYGLFKKFRINRDVVRTKNLEISMKKHGFSSGYPIVCTRDEEGYYVIVSGHHRFETAKKLNIPVKYIVLDKSEIPDIYEAEKATNTWKISDHLTSQVRAENENYIILNSFHKKTGIPISTCVGLFYGIAGGTAEREAFKQGNFNPDNIAFANRIGKIVLSLKRYGVPSSIACHQNMISALISCAYLDEFNDDEFLDKAKTFTAFFEKKATIIQYLQMIEDIYNYHRRINEKIFFVKKAETESRKRRHTDKSQEITLI